MKKVLKHMENCLLIALIMHNEWLKDNKMIKIIHSVDEFSQAVEEVLTHHDEPLNLKKAETGFDEMAREIKKMWKVD